METRAQEAIQRICRVSFARRGRRCDAKSMMMEMREAVVERGTRRWCFFFLPFRCDLTTLSVDDLSRDQQMLIWVYRGPKPELGFTARELR